MVDNLEELHRRMGYGESIDIPLDENTIEMFKHICSFTEEIAIELEQTSKGKGIIGRFESIEGFYAYLNDDLIIAFERLSSTNYMANIFFYYKELCVMSAKLNADNEHWNGTPNSVSLFDGYGRSNETRHNLSKSFQNYLNWVAKEIYNPMIERKNTQTLHKDNLYDEYIKTLK